MKRTNDVVKAINEVREFMADIWNDHGFGQLRSGSDVEAWTRKFIGTIGPKSLRDSVLYKQALLCVLFAGNFRRASSGYYIFHMPSLTGCLIEWDVVQNLYRRKKPIKITVYDTLNRHARYETIFYRNRPRR